jgi:hypothetical protein
MTFALASAAVVAVGCGKGNGRAPTAMTDDLKRDLQLASHTQDIQISPDEVTPQARQELSHRPKKAPNGPKVIRTQHPTVRASATPVEAAETETDIPQVQVMASAPAPSETPAPDAPPMARPAPIPAQSYPSTDRIPVANGGGTAGGILGGIFGAVIRGGVGDDDHCDPRRAPPRGRPVGGLGGVYSGNGNSPTGIAGGHIPVFIPRRGR